MRYFTIIFIFSVCHLAFSQTIKEIKSSEKYYWGEGIGQTLDKADKDALTDLISQISVQIQHSVNSGWSEENGIDNEYRYSMTNTYSAATLDRTERKVEETKKGTIVVRYILKSKMEEVFAERKEKIFDYIITARNAESDLRIGDALKYYFWSLALLRSHPDCNKIKYNLSGNEETTLLTSLPDKIDDILNSLSIDITSINTRENVKDIMIEIKYKNSITQNFDFTYWEGDTWSVQNSSKNGTGNIELVGDAATLITDLRIRAEYVFRKNSKIDSDVENVIENTNIPFFKTAESKLPLKENGSSETRKKEYKTQNKNIADKKITVKIDEYEKIIEKLETMIRSHKYSEMKASFTADGYVLFEKLMSYGKVKILPQIIPLKAIKYNNNVLVRSVPMSFSFPKSNKKFIEEVVFTFDSTTKINSISFALGEKTINNILQKDEAWGSMESKYQIIQFMEDYKTAYCLGRIDYLNQVFADNALIIVGSVLKNYNKPLDNMYMSLGEDNVKYIKFTKKEYIEKLRITFKRNEYVNIQFDECNINHPKKDQKIYGIQIAQNWYSSSYADKGYLFLLFDLTDSSKPQIFVRTWQPNKNADGTIYGVTDFKL